jgi:hypothetical protein
MNWGRNGVKPPNEVGVTLGDYGILAANSCRLGGCAVKWDSVRLRMDGKTRVVIESMEEKAAYILWCQAYFSLAPHQVDLTGVHRLY